MSLYIIIYIIYIIIIAIALLPVQEAHHYHHYDYDLEEQVHLFGIYDSCALHPDVVFSDLNKK